MPQTFHFHPFNVQLTGRVGWDGQITPPDGNERGCKETVRMNPLEDVVVALKPRLPKVLFVVPQSIRLMAPIFVAGTKYFPGTTVSIFTPFDYLGNPNVPPPPTRYIATTGSMCGTAT